MSFVKTDQEVVEIESLLSKGQFTTESLTIEFKTTQEFLRKVLKLAGTDVDPLDTIPVVEVGGVSYGEGASCWTIPFWEELDDGHDYRPYIYGQKYDDFRLFNKARRFTK